ncbi:unnamed protein product [Brassicogethes aeneus]|uniref:Glutaredoxin domain-containing protein n=1 Tax=Brassicogethes aeneus TaxID=1431903 RepID=A0A9P0BI96_BRAAE|nr:unnamed protein product [Brassicogethes aeneus]
MVVFNEVTKPQKQNELTKEEDPNLKQIEQLVNDMIKSDKIVIFSKSYCPYSQMAKMVPRVFINGTFIGGGSDIQYIHHKGMLQPLCDKTIDKDSIDLPKDQGPVLECAWAPKNKKPVDLSNDKESKDKEPIGHKDTSKTRTSTDNLKNGGSTSKTIESMDKSNDKGSKDVLKNAESTGKSIEKDQESKDTFKNKNSTDKSKNEGSTSKTNESKDKSKHRESIDKPKDSDKPKKK